MGSRLYKIVFVFLLLIVILNENEPVWSFQERHPAETTVGRTPGTFSKKFSYLWLLAAIRTHLSIIHQKPHFEQ